MDNLKQTHRLVAEFHRQCIASSWGQDVLQFYTTLWYAWLALSHLEKMFLLVNANTGDRDGSEFPRSSPTSYKPDAPLPMLFEESSIASAFNDSLVEDSIPGSPGILLSSAINNERSSSVNAVSKRVQRQRERNILRHRV
jgi:hypothetical protein